MVLSISDIFLEEMFFRDNTQKIALDNANAKAIERETVLNSFLNKSKDTLYSIRELKLFKQYLYSDKPKEIVEDVFLSYAKSQSTVMQLRFIDKDGVEQIRIDRDKIGSPAYLVPKDKLQDKSGRYYFYFSQNTLLEKVWFSTIDLNIENDKVETPYRPTLRAVLPIRHHNRFGGILIINYFMKDFLHKLTNAPLYDMIIYNNEGYTLYHYDDNKSWGFYKTPQFNISDEFLDHYHKLVSSSSFRTDSFASKKLNSPIDGGINVIFQLRKNHTDRQNSSSIHQYLLIFLTTFGLAFVLTILITKIYSQTLLNLNRLKLLNQELHDKSSELESIFDTALEGIAILDLDTKYLYSNNRYVDILEYSQEELKGKYCYDLTLPKFKEASKRVYQEVLINGHYKNFERACITKSGKIKYLQSSIALMPDKQSYLVTTVDVSKMKEQTKEIEEYLKIIDQNVIASRTNLKGEIIYASDKFVKSSGYSMDEILGSNHRMFRHEDMDKGIYIELWKAITSDKPWKGVLKNRRKDGSSYWVKLFISPQYNLDNKRVGYLSIRYDITEQKEIEEIALTDTLTQIYNRRYFDEMLPKLIEDAKNSKEHFCFAMLDVDNFKLYNDTYGHPDGDNVLRMIGELLKNSVDYNQSYSFRIGGEEFAILYRSKEAQKCLEAIKDIRKSIEELNIEHQYNSTYKHITVSIGVVCEDAKYIQSTQKIYKDVDKLLYQAKAEGRNRVVGNIPKLRNEALASPK